MKRKAYKLLKNVKTIDDLFIRVDIRDFLDEFIAKHLPDTEQMAIIFVKDGHPGIGVCGFEDREQLVGTMEGLKLTLLMSDPEDEDD